MTVNDPHQVHIIPAHPATDGDGVALNRVFPQPGFDLMDPFLLLDHLGPMDLSPDSTAGFPEHPHRGFETITYVLDGALAHKDSAGNEDVIKAGDAQWMTAASGIVHSEYPAPDFVAKGGTFHALQIWLNLPARDKMMPPRYQALKSDQIPRVAIAGGAATATVLGGRLYDVIGPAACLTPVTIAILEVEPGASLLLPIEDGWQCGLYLFDGDATLDGIDHDWQAGEMVALGVGFDFIPLNAGDQGAKLLLMSGAPLNESVARAGPFVMNTNEELQQAFDDYRAGRLG